MISKYSHSDMFDMSRPEIILVLFDPHASYLLDTCVCICVRNEGTRCPPRCHRHTSIRIPRSAFILRSQAINLMYETLIVHSSFVQRALHE